jgi:GNAT superfamily N-acetyltransferase
MTASVPGLLRTAAMKVITTFYRRMFAFVCPLDVPVPEQGPGGPAVVLLDEAQMADYCRLRPKQSPELVRRRLAAGHECFLVRQHGELVHAGWVGAGRVLVPYLNRDLLLEPHEIYTYDVFTRPDRRGQGHAVVRFQEMQRRYLERGYRSTFSLVAVENRAGMALTFKSQGRIVGTYRAVRVGPWQRVWSRALDDEPLPQLLPPGGPA